MRYLVISDIHSNLAAFEAVLADAGEYDKVWCLGDLVGYGPRPNECIERLRQLDHVCVAGNHDWAAIGKLDLEDFNADARRACLWTRKTLSPENWKFLESLPERLEFPDLDFTLVHGSPRHPIWEYILSPFTAEANFAHFDTRFCLVGHTHVPTVFRQRPWDPGELSNPLHLGEERLIINPGSVGQ
ncbi:MAG: metallophosphoesterase family protein, partial [Chloroflexota bacterium]|nr:metallophosphoesterase family protein [Chloroflexota bacterium]